MAYQDESSLHYITSKVLTGSLREYHIILLENQSGYPQPDVYPYGLDKQWIF